MPDSEATGDERARPEGAGASSARISARLRRWATSLWPAGLLALLCLAFYIDALSVSPGQLVGGNDLANMFLHWLQFAVSSLKQGRLPLWNPYLFSGTPFVANPQPALFYPPTWLALIMPANRALAAIIVLHVWLAGVGMVGWLRSEGVSRAGALFGGIIFAFSGYFMVRVRSGHLGVISTGAWLPVILWAYREVAKRRSWKLAIVGGLPVGLSILAGHTASFIYVALALAAYAALYAWRGWRAARTAPAALWPLAWLGIMGVVGGAVAGVQLLPMAELVALSTRQDSSYGFASAYSWSPGYLLTLLIPNFFGEPVRTGYWGDGIYDEIIFYVGVLPLILALLGLRLRHRLTHFLAALGLVGLLLAMGPYTALHPLVYRFVPLFRVMRAPARAGFLFTLAAAALAGLALSELMAASPERRVKLLKPLSRQVVVVVVCGALALSAAGFLAYAWGRESNEAAGRLWHVANRVAFFLVMFLLAAGWVAAWRGDVRRRVALGALAIALALLDLWSFGREIVQVVDVPENAYWRVVDQAVSDQSTGRVLPWALPEFDQNGGMPLGIRSVFGYDPLVLQRYQEFITSQPDPRARTYDLLSAEYLVLTTSNEWTEGPDAPQLILDQDGVRVYHRPNALPRAWVTSQIEVLDSKAILARIHESTFDPRTTALVETAVSCAVDSAEVSSVQAWQDGENRVSAQVAGGGGLLIFSEVDYPGWQAAIDGDPAPIIRADYLFRAVCVPAGAHEVVLTYDPPLLKIGLVVTVGALLLVVGAAVAWRGTRRRSSAVERQRL